MSRRMPRRIVIAGASGFVGLELMRRLSPQTQIIALTRSSSAPVHLPEHNMPGVYWLQCNLFSLKQTELALTGAEAAYFLVHSMLPKAQLTQGEYDNLDLIIADNFSRASSSAGVRRIIYLGGILPQRSKLSDHLRSRLEVEKTLRSRTQELVALRAGLVLGPGGSSSTILLRLIRRLPVLVCPAWTRKQSSPIALDDTVDALVAALDHEEVPAGTYDLQGPELVSYRQLMSRTALELGLKRRFIPFFGVSPKLSRLWVSLVTGASRELVSPLIQSLLVDMIPGKTTPIFTATKAKTNLLTAIRQADQPKTRTAEPPRSTAPVQRQPEEQTVVSIQRLALPAGWTAQHVAGDYAQWLPRLLRPFLRLETSEDNALVKFFLMGSRVALLELTYMRERSDAERALFFVSGGLLRKRNSNPLARLEFRVIAHERIVLSAVLDFSPALPWFIYRLTQAQAHRFVMWCFGRRLKKL